MLTRAEETPIPVPALRPTRAQPWKERAEIEIWKHPLKENHSAGTVWESTTPTGKLSLRFPDCRGPFSGCQPRTYAVQLLMQGKVLRALHLNLLIVLIY